MKEKYGIDYFDDIHIEGEEKELFTMGDFNKQGQRVVLTENISDKRDDEIKMSNSELLDSIKSFLKESTIQEEEDEGEVLNIIRYIFYHGFHE